MSAPEDPYPEIGNMLARAAPPSWERIELDAHLWDGGARIKATGYLRAGRAVSLDVRPELRLLELLQRVQAISREVADPGTPVWTTAKFVLRSDGEFDVRFGYDEDEEGLTPPSQPPAHDPSPPPKRPWWRF